jgi:Amt family ammonium transporter
MIGLLADPATPGSFGHAGLLYGGGLDQLSRQFIASVVVGVYAFVVSYLIARVIKKLIGWRISASDEIAGIDLAEHSEVGYDLSPVYYTNKIQRTLVLTKDDFAEPLQTGAEK